MGRVIGVRSRQTNQTPFKGFTLLELLVIVMIIGILAAILIPYWGVLLNRIRLSNAQDTIMQAMQMTKSNAKRSRTLQQFSVRTLNGTVQWASSAATREPDESLWKSLDPAIQLDDETSLQRVGNIRRVQFTHEGSINGQLGRVTLSIKSGGKLKRCVIVSTLLGKVRTSAEQRTKKDDKYCY
jgi:prepilin-type N-terminal cleavage/methylation domain-containing protein